MDEQSEPLSLTRHVRACFGSWRRVSSYSLDMTGGSMSYVAKVKRCQNHAQGPSPQMENSFGCLHLEALVVSLRTKGCQNLRVTGANHHVSPAFFFFFFLESAFVYRYMLQGKDTVLHDVVKIVGNKNVKKGWGIKM